LGLDRPYHEQYALWLWQMVSLNPGDSIFTNEPIAVSLRKAIPATLELAALAMIIGILTAVPVGVLSATPQASASDHVGRVGEGGRGTRGLRARGVGDWIGGEQRRRQAVDEHRCPAGGGRGGRPDRGPARRGRRRGRGLRAAGDGRADGRAGPVRRVHGR